MSNEAINEIDAQIAEVKDRINADKACLNELRAKKHELKLAAAAKETEADA